MTTDSDPLYNPPLYKSDDVVANEKQEFEYMNLYFSLLDTGIEIRTGFRTGSKETIVNTDETNSTGLTKRLGEVDYTRAESFT